MQDKRCAQALSRLKKQIFATMPMPTVVPWMQRNRCPVTRPIPANGIFMGLGKFPLKHDIIWIDLEP